MKMTNGTIANIERAKREWESTFDAVSDLISIHDNKFRIIRANKACAGKFNFLPKELIGRYCYELFHGTIGPIDGCPQEMAFQTGENTNLEWADPATGTTYDISVYPLFDDDNKVKNVIHVVKDITMLKRVENELRTLNETMLQRNIELQVAIGKASEEAEINKALLEISREVMDVMDPAFLLKKVAVISSKMFKPDIIMAFLWNEEREIYVQVSATGAEHILTINVDNFPPIGEILRTKSLTFIENGEDPLLHDGVINSLHLNAMSIIPFLVRNKVVGFIINCFYSPRSFTFRDRNIMEGMGYQISLALNNAYLYRESMEKTMELSYKVETIEVMHEIDRGVLALTDRNELLEKISYMLDNLIPCNGIIILLMDNEARAFRFAAGWGVELAKGEVIPFDDINYSEFLKPPRIVVRTELKAEDLLPLDSKLYKTGVRSDIRVPLFSGNEVTGVLNILSHRIAGFTTSQLNTIEMISSQISVALDNARLVEDLQELLIGTSISLAVAIEAKSPWTKGHSERVTEYARTIGLQMGLTKEELENLRLAGLLHDLGKLGTYEGLLEKPERLTPEEFETVKRHPAEAIRILKPVKALSSIFSAILHHHEYYDGTGYPDGLKGDDIPFLARILCVADAYDSMTSNRPYRQSPGREYALYELSRCSGTQFDPQIVGLFLKNLTTTDALNTAVDSVLHKPIDDQKT